MPARSSPPAMLTADACDNSVTRYIVVALVCGCPPIVRSTLRNPARQGDEPFPLGMFRLLGDAGARRRSGHWRGRQWHAGVSSGRSLARRFVPDVRDDDVVATRHRGDAIGAGRVGYGSAELLQYAAVRSQPRIDLHVLHRLAALVGDDAADGACRLRLGTGQLPGRRRSSRGEDEDDHEGNAQMTRLEPPREASIAPERVHQASSSGGVRSAISSCA